MHGLMSHRAEDLFSSCSETRVLCTRFRLHHCLSDNKLHILAGVRHLSSVSAEGRKGFPVSTDVKMINCVRGLRGSRVPRRPSLPAAQRPSILTQFANQFTSLVFVFCIVFVEERRGEMIHFGEERSREEREAAEERVRWKRLAAVSCIPPLYLSLFRFTLCLRHRLTSHSKQDPFDIMMIMRVMSEPEVHEEMRDAAGGRRGGQRRKEKRDDAMEATMRHPEKGSLLSLASW